MSYTIHHHLKRAALPRGLPNPPATVAHKRQVSTSTAYHTKNDAQQRQKTIQAVHSKAPATRSHTSPGVHHRLLRKDDVNLAVDRGGGPEVPVQPLPEVRDGAVPARQQDVRVELWSQRCGTADERVRRGEGGGGGGAAAAAAEGRGREKTSAHTRKYRHARSRTAKGRACVPSSRGWTDGADMDPRQTGSST